MSDPGASLDRVEQRRRALSRWDNEGGAIPAQNHEKHVDLPDMTNAELVQLRIRVIALENLLIGLLADGSDKQLETAREMAEYISPRPGFTQHPLTIQAADHMTDLVARAVHFRTVTDPTKMPAP